MTNPAFSLTTTVRSPGRSAVALRIFVGAALAWSWLEHPVRAATPRLKSRPSALEILRYGDPKDGVPVVEFSCAAGKFRGELLRPVGECAVPGDEGRALRFASGHARVLLPGGRFTIAITRWPNPPKVVRLIAASDGRLLPLAPDRSVAEDALVTEGVVAQSAEGQWIVSFDTALPAGEYALITGSPTIENVMYDFSVEPVIPVHAKK